MTVLLDMGCSLSLNKQCSASRRVRQDSSHSYVSRSTQRDHRTTREEAVGSDPKHDIRLQSILSRYGPAAERRRWGHRRYSATAVGATAEYLRLVVDC